MNMWWTLVLCVPMHAMVNIKKEIKGRALESEQNAKALVMTNNSISKEKGYQSDFSGDLTEWQIFKEKKTLRNIESKYPIIVVDINHELYSYSNNKAVVLGALQSQDSKDPVILDISNVDFLSWNPEEKQLLIRSLLDGIGYFVYDTTDKKCWRLTAEKGLWERIVGYVVCTLGLPGINYISNVHWQNKDTLVDTQRKITWSLKEEIIY